MCASGLMLVRSDPSFVDVPVPVPVPVPGLETPAIRVVSAAREMARESLVVTNQYPQSRAAPYHPPQNTKQHAIQHTNQWHECSIHAFDNKIVQKMHFCNAFDRRKTKRRETENVAVGATALHSSYLPPLLIVFKLILSAQIPVRA